MSRDQPAEQQYKYQSRGLLFSLVGHFFVFISLFIGSFFNGEDLGPETIYSITLEGGAQLGGISQAPNKNNKEKPAPPKPVSGKVEEKKEEEKSKPDPVKEEKKVEPKVEQKEAEVSTKVEPQASPKPETKKEEKKADDKKEEPKKPEPPKKKEEKSEKPKKDPNQEKMDLEKEYQKAMQRYQGESTDAGGQGFGAGRIGGQGMGGGEQRPPEFFTYRDLIKRTVKRNWNWFDTATSLRATITFSISQNGELTDVSIVKSSGNSLFDNSVIRAVLKSSPLEPPPENVYQYFKVVRTEFDPQD